MKLLLMQKWWIWLIRGAAGILLGGLALAWPGITLTVLVLFLGVYLLIDGVFTAIAAISHRREVSHWWVVLLEGLAGVLIGIITLLWPQITAMALLYLVAFWALFTGILEIIAAGKLRKEIIGEWLMVLSGILSIAFAVLIVIWPRIGLLTLTYIIAFYVILFGVALIALALRVRKAQYV